MGYSNKKPAGRTGSRGGVTQKKAGSARGRGMKKPAGGKVHGSGNF